MKVEFKNVFFSYVEDDIEARDDELVLKNISFVIPEGQMVAIIGHNGSGKSTIAKIIMGLLGVNSGEVLLDDVVLSTETVDELRSRMGIIFQNPDYQFVGSTVRDDIAFGLENHLVSRDEMIQKIDKYAKLVRMENFLERSPENLSGGQKQRVCIAGALAMETEVIIFDEATSMLDPQGTSEVLEMIKELRDTMNKTIITITHNLAEIVYADRVIALNDGVVVLDGTPQEVMRETDKLKSIGLHTLESIDLIELINGSEIIPSKKDELVKALWELTFQM